MLMRSHPSCARRGIRLIPHSFTPNYLWPLSGSPGCGRIQHVITSVIRKQIRRIAAREGKTKSEVVLDALREYTAKKRSEKLPSMAESMKVYIGVGKSKRTDLSSQTGKTIQDILIEKKKSRRL